MAGKSLKKAKYSTATKAFKLEGIPEMKKTLTSLRLALDATGNDQLSVQVRLAMKKPMDVVRDEARSIVSSHRRSGELEDSIHSFMSRKAPAAGVAVNKFYGRFLEYGTSKMAASPFFWPAVRATRPQCARMIAEGLKPVLAEVARQNAWKSSGGV